MNTTKMVLILVIAPIAISYFIYSYKLNNLKNYMFHKCMKTGYKTALECDCLPKMFSDEVGGAPGFMIGRLTHTLTNEKLERHIAVAMEKCDYK